MECGNHNERRNIFREWIIFTHRFCVCVEWIKLYWSPSHISIAFFRFFFRREDSISFVSCPLLKWISNGCDAAVANLKGTFLMLPVVLFYALLSCPIRFCFFINLASLRFIPLENFRFEVASLASSFLSHSFRVLSAFVDGTIDVTRNCFDTDSHCYLCMSCMLQCQLSKHELATISARAERHIGTQGGGMDQAIAFLAKAGNYNIH